MGALVTAADAPEDIAEGGERNDPPRLPVAFTADAPATLAEATPRRHDGIGHAGRLARIEP